MNNTFSQFFIWFCIFTTTLYSTDFATMQEGEKLYLQTCVSCHNEDGSGSKTIHLVVKPRDLRTSILSQQQMFQVIKYGAYTWGSHADIMPSFGSVYSDSEINALATYVFTKFNVGHQKFQNLLRKTDTTTKVSLNEGKKLFNKRCALCHGYDGKGHSQYIEFSKKNKNFLYPYNLRKTILDENQIFLYIKYGGLFWGSSKDDMPAWKDIYTDVQLRSIAKYIVKSIKQPLTDR